MLLILGIAGSFALELWFSRPDMAESSKGARAARGIVRNPDMLYIAIILGATVMPHNLYCSSIVQRACQDDE